MKEKDLHKYSQDKGVKNCQQWKRNKQRIPVFKDFSSIYFPLYFECGNRNVCAC